MSYTIAKSIVETEKIPIECRYLEGSRFAWRCAELSLESTDLADKICIGGVFVTLRIMLQRTGLAEHEIIAVATELANQRGLILDEELDRPLNYIETQNWKPYIRQCELLKKLVRQHGRDLYNRTMDYFAQEGLFEAEGGESYGIVDSGWVGSLQQTLNTLLVSDKKWKGQIQGFYFGLYELPPHAVKSKYHTFYFRPYRDIEKKVWFNNCLFEAVCSAEEGMTIAYCEKNGCIISVKNSSGNGNREEIHKDQKLLVELLQDSVFLRGDMCSKQEALKQMKRLMSNPSLQEAQLYGSYYFSDNVLENGSQTLAANLTEKDLVNHFAIRRLLLMTGVLHGEIKDSAWIEGSAILAGISRYKLFRIRWYKRMIYIRKWMKGCRR